MKSSPLQQRFKNLQQNVYLTLQKFVIILYKNLLLRLRQWVVTAFEVCLPILMVLFMCYQNASTDFVDHYPTQMERLESDRNFKNLESAWCKNETTLAYYPENTETKMTMEQLGKECQNTVIDLKPLNSEETLDINFTSLFGKGIGFGIVFPDQLAALKGNVKDATISYKLRTRAGKLPTTAKLIPTLGDADFKILGPNDKNGNLYFDSRFLSLQLSLDKVLAKLITGQNNFEYKINLERFKYPPHREKYRGSRGASIMVPLFLALSVLFMIPTITRNVVSEKQTGIVELLKSSGVPGWIQWLGWMINSLVPMLFTIIFCTIFLYARLGGKTDLGKQYEAVLVYSNWTVICLILFLYINATISFCFLVSAIFRKPTIATTLAILLWVVTAFIPWTVWMNKIAASLIPNCAVAYAFYLAYKLDTTVEDDSDRPIGVRWDSRIMHLKYPMPKRTFPIPDNDSSDISMFEILMMLLLDVVLYFLLALYFDSVLPSEHGVRRPWYIFNFNFKQWRKHKPPADGNSQQVPPVATGEVIDPDSQQKPQESPSDPPVIPGDGENPQANQAQESSGDVEANLNNTDPTTAADSSFEPEPKGVVGIDIQNIYKQFGRKSAVNGVTLRMFTGDIFALLGHNGAGKTSLISMLTGFFAPSKGTAIVEGYDIRYDLAKARKHMGLCPQHNMLFDKLTVSDQLCIFGMLRGLTSKQAKQETNFLLSKMKYSEKASTLAYKLSGGQKRKLSLGMALIGGTKVVVLDEPTSGMDPQARREIWDLLLELRGERTILLTTHFMEEADVLGDRIGIMASGKLQCCGSSQFLKKFYGTGFTLKLSLKRQDQTQANPQEPNATSENDPETLPNSTELAAAANIYHDAVTKILAIVQKYVPNAAPKRDSRNDMNSNEVFFSLPAEKSTTATLTQMFTELNGSKEKLQIQTIGLQQTTMDEVFLRVGEMAEEEHGAFTKYDWTQDDFQKVQKNSGFKRWLWQFVALLIKRGIMIKRKWLLLLVEMILTYLIICGAILMLQNGFHNTVKLYIGIGNRRQHAPSSSRSSSTTSTALQPELLISLDKYTDPVTYYSAADYQTRSYVEKVIGRSAQKIDGSNIQDKLVKIGKSDIRQYKHKHIVGVNVGSKSQSPLSITVMFNAFPYHASPLAINLATNIALRSINPDGNIRIQVFNHPLGTPIPEPTPDSYRRQHEDSFQGEYHDKSCKPFDQLELCAGAAVLIILGLMCFTSTFVVTPIEEKVCNVKQLQLMTGVHPLSYWCANFLWDITLYLLVVILVLVSIVAIELSPGHLQVLSFPNELFVLFVILMIYGCTSILLAYLVSLRASTVAGGFSLVILIQLFTGVILGFGAVMLMFQPILPSFLYGIFIVHKIIGYPFATMPGLLTLARYFQIALGNAACDYIPLGLFRQSVGSYEQERLGGFTKHKHKLRKIPHLQWEELVQGYGSYAVVQAGETRPDAGQDLFFVIFDGLIYLVLLLLIEYGVFKRYCTAGTDVVFNRNTDDDDVLQEGERVSSLAQNGQLGEECMVVDNLCKAFGGFTAVSQVSFGVHYGECFGLLGVNGAGKTTVFKMITGDEQPNIGNMFGFGVSTTENPRQFFSNIGYCQQFDSNIGILTGREMLQLFGLLRGIPYKQAKIQSMKWLQRFGLSESANVQSGKYSGGMKRRLNTAMAMIGDPRLILLDEPTSGVDPVSRHQFWGILAKLRDSGQSIILTSHSMEECEALCSRLGIMVNGQFQCFGGVQHLKNKFAQGYNLTLNLKSDLPFETAEFKEELQKFEETIIERFKPCVLKDNHQTLRQYHIQNPLISWDALFKIMEGIKTEFETMIEDYSVNETSLEEVFLSFARAQTGVRSTETSLCRQICTCRC